MSGQMKYRGKVAAGEQSGMHAYQGKAWGGDGRDHEAVYDLDNVREAPEFEKAATSFETKLGAWAFTEADGHAQAVSNKVIDYMALKYEGAEALSAELDAKLGQLSGLLPDLGTDAPYIAGAVGTKAGDIKGVILEGNLRERMVVVENFAKRVLAEDITDKAGLEALLAKADEALNFQKSLLMDSETGSEVWETGEHNRGQTEVAEGDQFRAKGSDLSTDLTTDSTGSAAEASANSGKRTRASTSETLPKASERGGSNPVGQFEGARQAELGVGEGEGMKWGNPVADMVMNEANDWVKRQRTIGMPLKGGPSGHTHKFMMVNQILGMPITADQMRVVCLGHLLPINAHTFVEVMEAAKGFGATAYPESAMMYRHLAPYNEGLKSAIGADKFPDEVMEESERSAAAGVATPESTSHFVPDGLDVGGGSAGASTGTDG